MGVPFLPALTMLGSDLMGVGGTKTIADPYTGETLAAVPALFPDVAFIHVHRADRFGNAQIDGYPHMDADIARAATTVLMTTEEIVPEEETRRYPERTVIPGFAVDALVLAPFGVVSPRVLRPLRGRLRALRGVHGGHRHGGAGRRRRLSRSLRLRAARPSTTTSTSSAARAWPRSSQGARADPMTATRCPTAKRKATHGHRVVAKPRRRTGHPRPTAPTSLQ